MACLSRVILLLVFFALVGRPQAQGEDCIPTDPAQVSLETYYAPAAGATGSALRAALHGIIKGHRRFSYTCVWTILEDADVDPANPDNVIALYTGRSIPKSRRDQGQNDPSGKRPNVASIIRISRPATRSAAMGDSTKTRMNRCARALSWC